MAEVLDLRYPEATDAQLRSLLRVPINPLTKAVIIKSQLITDVNVLGRYHKIESVELADLRLGCSLPEILLFFSLSENFPVLHTLKLHRVQFSKGLGVFSTRGAAGTRASGSPSKGSLQGPQDPASGYHHVPPHGSFPGISSGPRNALSRLEISGISLPRGVSSSAFLECVSESVNRLSLASLVLEVEEVGQGEERATISAILGSDQPKEAGDARRASDPLLLSGSLSAITPFPRKKAGAVTPARRREPMASSALAADAAGNAEREEVAAAAGEAPAHGLLPAAKDHPETQYTFTKPSTPGGRSGPLDDTSPNLTYDFFTRSKRLDRRLVYSALNCFPSLRELNGAAITQQDLLEAANRTQAYMGSLRERLAEALELYRQTYAARLAGQETIHRLEAEAAEARRELADARGRVAELEVRLLSSEALLREQERKSVEALMGYTLVEKEEALEARDRTSLANTDAKEAVTTVDECVFTEHEPGLPTGGLGAGSSLAWGRAGDNLSDVTFRDIGAQTEDFAGELCDETAAPRDTAAGASETGPASGKAFPDEALRSQLSSVSRELLEAQAELSRRQSDLEKLAMAFRELEEQNEALRAAQAAALAKREENACAGVNTAVQAFIPAQSRETQTSVELPPRDLAAECSPRTSTASERTKLNMTLSALQAVRDSAKELREELVAKDAVVASLAREKEALHSENADLRLKYTSLKRDSRKLAKLVVKVVEVQKQLDAANRAAELRKQQLTSRAIQASQASPSQPVSQARAESDRAAPTAPEVPGAIERSSRKAPRSLVSASPCPLSSDTRESPYCSPAILLPDARRNREPAHAPAGITRESPELSEAERRISAIYDAEFLEVERECRREVDSLEKRWKAACARARGPSVDSLDGEEVRGSPLKVQSLGQPRMRGQGATQGPARALTLSEPGRMALRAWSGRSKPGDQKGRSGGRAERDTPHATGASWSGRVERLAGPTRPSAAGLLGNPGALERSWGPRTSAGGERLSSFLLGLEDAPAGTPGASSLISEIEVLLDAADLVLAASE